MNEREIKERAERILGRIYIVGVLGFLMMCSGFFIGSPLRYALLESHAAKEIRPVVEFDRYGFWTKLKAGTIETQLLVGSEPRIKIKPGKASPYFNKKSKYGIAWKYSGSYCLEDGGGGKECFMPDESKEDRHKKIRKMMDHYRFVAYENQRASISPYLPDLKEQPRTVRFVEFIKTAIIAILGGMISLGTFVILCIVGFDEKGVEDFLTKRLQSKELSLRRGQKETGLELHFESDLKALKKFSWVPFVGGYYRRRMKEYREYVEEMTDLVGSLIRHQRATNKLEDLPGELEEERFIKNERVRELLRKFKKDEIRDEIEIEELEEMYEKYKRFREKMKNKI